jgi:hypothetical protein
MGGSKKGLYVGEVFRHFPKMYLGAKVQLFLEFRSKKLELRIIQIINMTICQIFVYLRPESKIS